MEGRPPSHCCHPGSVALVLKGGLRGGSQVPIHVELTGMWWKQSRMRNFWKTQSRGHLRVWECGWASISQSGLSSKNPN